MASSLTNAQILDLIGEIDGIEFETVEGMVKVYVDVGGSRVFLVGYMPNDERHYITRIGIAKCIVERRNHGS